MQNRLSIAKHSLQTSLLALACIGFALPAHAEKATILGGGLKGGAYQLAVGLSKVLKQKSDINATPQSAKGMVGQARILNKNGAQFAFGLGGPIGAWAYQGVRRFKDEGPKKNLRAILSYPAGSLQWLALADSDLKNVSELKGKKVSVGSASSTTQTFARLLLPAHGLEEGSYTERTPGFSGGFGALRDRNVDAHLTVGRPPMSAVQELTALKKIRLLDMDPASVAKVIKENGPGLAASTIDKGVYGDNHVNVGPVNSLAIFFGFSTNEETSADLVYEVTKALFENLPELQKTTKAAKGISLESACSGLALPLHEGAKRYYKEVGKTDC